MKDTTSMNIKKYPLRIRTLTDLRAYCSLVDTCPFNGYIQAPDRKLAKEDVIGLLTDCLNKNLLLCIRSGNANVISTVEMTLKETGLSACTAA